MKLNLTEITSAREQYRRNMARLAELDAELAKWHTLRTALNAHRANPCNVTWRMVLSALKEAEAAHE